MDFWEAGCLFFRYTTNLGSFVTVVFFSNNHGEWRCSRVVVTRGVVCSFGSVGGCRVVHVDVVGG